MSRWKLKKHKCEYKVPIEWSEESNRFVGGTGTSLVERQYPILTKVTKLRCVCGKEINLGGSEK